MLLCECPRQGHPPGLVRPPCPELPLHSAGSCGAQELGRPGFELYPLPSYVTLNQLLNLSVPLLSNLSPAVAVMVKPENTCKVLISTGPG